MNLNAMQPRFDRGYTGHEHMCGFGLINMPACRSVNEGRNGRLYDPYLQRFLSPDPYVQFAGNPQNFNRYSYVLNNPLMYTDPSGEIIDLALFLIGSYIIGAVYHGQQPGGWDWKAANRGGLATLFTVGSMVASIALPGLVPAWPGAIPGLIMAGGQFTLTAVQTGSFNWMTHGTFTPNWKMAGLSAIPGLIKAGVDGINAMRQGGNFLTGKGIKHDYILNDLRETRITIPEDMEYSKSFAQNFSDENLAQWSKPVKNLYVDELPTGYTATGDIIYNEAGRQVGGCAAYQGFGKTDVYLFKAAFTSKEMLFMVMGHEYLHAALFAGGYTYIRFNYNTNKLSSFHEATIARWQLDQAIVWNYRVTHYQNYFNLYRGTSIDYRNLGFYVLSIKPWL